MNEFFLGSAYYPEVWPEENIDGDFKKMKEVGLNSVRIAEFAWSTMEREEGKYDFSLFLKVLDKAKEYGIDVVMCTPSATPPKWLTDKYEETMSVKSDGNRRQFGGRCHPCKTSPIMRKKTERLSPQCARLFPVIPPSWAGR